MSTRGLKRVVSSSNRSLPSIESLDARRLFAVTIKIDYSTDTTGFFTDPARKTVLELAATTLGSRLGDTLSAITPSGQNTWTMNISEPTTGAQKSIVNPTIPANTLVVYVGARDLPGSTLGLGGYNGYNVSGITQAWFDTVAARSETGALANPATDFGPAGGSIAFDSVAAWNFSTSGPAVGKNDFYSVALHELGHVLGIGTSFSWRGLISGSNTFTGAKSVASYGQAVPLDPGQGHWKDGTLSGGKEAAMDPSITTGTRKVFTALDFAGLDDIGWDILPPPPTAGSIAGIAFNDVNGNGVKDSNDAGQSGWQVFIDANKNGIFDTGEKTTTTSSTGAYTFTNLAPGSYRIREAGKTGWRKTVPSAYYDVTVASGQNVTGKNFGNTQKVLITGTVFKDLNGDKVQNTGEVGLSGWRVFVDLDGNGVYNSADKSVLTDSTGAYKFTDLAAGTYKVYVVQQAGYTRTTPTTSGGAYTLTLSSGATTTGKIFGEKPIV